MTFKPDRSGGDRPRRPHRRPAEEHRRLRQRSSSRVLLFSSQDPERLEYVSRQNDRVRLISQIVATQQDLPREFTSYFHSAKNNPPYLVTSHSRSRRRPVVPLFPSLLQQTLNCNWDPFVATASTSQDYIPETPKEKEKKYNCRCEDCTSPRCPFRTTSTNDLKQSIFKDNIITFCDQFTMTPKVNDVACGICLGVTPTTETRSVDVTSSLSNVQEEDSASFNKNSGKQKCPSILKRCLIEGKPADCIKRPECCDRTRHELSDRNTMEQCDRMRREYDRPRPNCNRPNMDYDRPHMDCGMPHRDYDRPDMDYNKPRMNCEYESNWRPTRTYEVRHEAERDVEPNECYIEPSACKSNKSLCKQGRRRCNEDLPDYKGKIENRRMLYNEGISDSTIKHFPNCATKKPSPMNLATNSKVSVGRCYAEVDNWIPFSHRSNSKYHEDCKKGSSQPYYAAGPDELKLAECQRHTPRAFGKKPVAPPPCRPICINLPKKLLTSEKDIEAFIINGKKYCRAED